MKNLSPSRHLKITETKNTTVFEVAVVAVSDNDDDDDDDDNNNNNKPRGHTCNMLSSVTMK